MTAYPDVTALVTGGASGIGAATATRLRAAGVRVVTADVAAGADEKLDITDPDAVDALRDALGPVGILVNSAGVVGPSRPLTELGLDEWRATFRINVDGTFLMCRAFVPGMVSAGWGRVVNWPASPPRTATPRRAPTRRRRPRWSG
jgi:3-oxoacyl-[acyl-carrier protein] reductase